MRGRCVLSRLTGAELPEATMVMRKQKGVEVSHQISGLAPRMPDMSQFDVSARGVTARVMFWQGTATMKMPEVRRFKKKFSSGAGGAAVTAA